MKIEVPTSSFDYYINNIGAVRYSDSSTLLYSTVPQELIGFFLTKFHHITNVFSENGKKFIVIEEMGVERHECSTEKHDTEFNAPDWLPEECHKRRDPNFGQPYGPRGCNEDIGTNGGGDFCKKCLARI